MLDSNGMAACRSGARRFLRSLRMHASDVGMRGGATVASLVEDVAREAATAADAQPSREHRRQFLVELASEARSEWMVQAEPDGPRAVLRRAQEALG